MIYKFRKFLHNNPLLYFGVSISLLGAALIVISLLEVLPKVVQLSLLGVLIAIYIPFIIWGSPWSLKRFDDDNE